VAGLATCSLVLFSCSTDSPNTPGGVVQNSKEGIIQNAQSTRTSISGLFFSPCASELIDVTGELHNVTRTHENADGSVDLNIKLDIKASGIGRTSGEKYNVISHTTDEFDFTAGPPYPYTRTFDRTVRLVSSSSASNAVLTLTIELTVNSSGKIVLRVTMSSTDCQ
jgi:hypothetical protein